MTSDENVSAYDSDDRLMELDLEYRLTIAHRINCWCAPYLVNRRQVLLPEVLKIAKAKSIDPVNLFASFAQRVHDRHSGLKPQLP